MNDEDLRKAVREACYEKAYAVAASGNNNKHERFAAFEAIREEFKAQFSEEELDEKGALIDRYYHDVEKEAMRRSILDEGKRLDVVRLLKSARSGVRLVLCLVLTDLLSLLVVKHNH